MRHRVPSHFNWSLQRTEGLSINSLNSSTANIRVNDGYQRPVDTSSTNSDDGDTAGARNISLYPLIDEADNQTVNFVKIFPVKA